MAADPGPGPEGHEAKGFGGGRVDHLPGVEAHPLAEQGQLVDQGDVHVAEDVFEELGELGGIGRGELVHGRADLAQQARGAGRPRRRQAPDQARDRAAGAGRVTRIHAFGRVRQVKVAPGNQPRAFQLGPERTAGGARVGGRLEDDQLAGAELAADSGRGAEDRAEIGILGLVDRRRDAHEDRIGRGKVSCFARFDAQAAGEGRLERCVIDVIDRRVPADQLADPALIRVDAKHAAALVREAQREGQADVAEADDGDVLIGAQAASAISGAGRWVGAIPPPLSSGLLRGTHSPAWVIRCNPSW